ncbi:MAG: tyrosinase family oxidase copper chaperone [Gemmatimonadota bacterium]|nr:tyrosinase family oxidase copper chaperone [Gemmatimonadota bacterium]MDH3369291.1 tyrosinase family oxidase copper chaperone [Gemmatimonadota bacterium]MDH3478198.1 tyrosinase family oxidase copper chaperone [Gemmatimonadota bacterium]MDH3570351.1 tyrosinase family oxidase copper chaperone [Gemmatimonadota bacterium]MDH5551017.1 tyrosinase family oxidase copper chaperone [Gemmatimonadota bacterium]
MRPTATLVLAVAVAGGVAACAAKGGVEAAAPAPAPLDPVGVYSFSTIYQGGPMTGRIVIRGAPGSYTGTVEPADGPPPTEIYSVIVEGQELQIVADAGGEDLIIAMTFAGDRFTGSWILGFDSGEMTGTRVER